MSQSVLADVVYISGAKHTLSKADFQRSGNTYTANIEVIGDYGQSLIFDVDAIVAGKGYQEREVIYFTYHPDEPPCTESYIKFLLSFRYMVDLKVSCNGIAIGSDTENKNELVNEGIQVRSTRREVSLLVDNQLVTHGNCGAAISYHEQAEFAQIDHSTALVVKIL